MMYTSRLLFTTLKETPADAKTTNHQLLLRAGMIQQLSAGLYTWLPLGLRVLQKIKNIIRQELNRIGGLEIVMPSIQPAELWHLSNRWQQYGDELLKIKDRQQRHYCYAPTAEEVATVTMRQLIKSYKQLPAIVYQITYKFRDEIRPRFGVMRAREFLMKDAYSFDKDQSSLATTYQTMFDSYHSIFTRLGLNFRAVLADTGLMGGNQSHEFQVLAKTGEDEILYSDSSQYAANIEIAAKAGLKAGDASPDGQGMLCTTRGIEVGHIYQLGDKYSKVLYADHSFDKDSKTVVQMGCYGIGISRIVGAAIEQHHDDKGIIWPQSLAPFQIAIIAIGWHHLPAIRQHAQQLYHQLTHLGYEVLCEDRKLSPGVMFNDIDLIGIPHRLVLSKRGLQQQTIEYKARCQAHSQAIACEQLMAFIKKTVAKPPLNTTITRE